jgi:hypothetical protein
MEECAYGDFDDDHVAFDEDDEGDDFVARPLTELELDELLTLEDSGDPRDRIVYDSFSP